MLKFISLTLILVFSSMAQYKYVVINDDLSEKETCGSKTMPISIDISHKRVHDGKVFWFSNLIESVGNGDSVIFRVTTDSNSYHGTFACSVGGSFYGSLYGIADTVFTESKVEGFNRNGNYLLSITTGIGVCQVTVGVLSGLGAQALLAGGVGNKCTGGNIGESEEFVIAPNTTMYLCYKNVSGAVQPISVTYNFHKDDGEAK